MWNFPHRVIGRLKYYKQLILIKDIQRYIEKKGYEFFSKTMELNIIGETLVSELTNRFDDVLHLIYKDTDGYWIHHRFPVTTQPGKYWMENPLNVDGTAILVPGQYKDVYKIDKHRGAYDAMCQRYGPVKVFRDGNRDNVYDMLPETVQSGLFGINIHRSNPYTESTLIDKWSAGCQVFKKQQDFGLFMDICFKSQDEFGFNKFTYTLIDRRAA